MNRTSLALGAIAVFFAGTTVYFAHALYRERARGAASEGAVSLAGMPAEKSAAETPDNTATNASSTARSTQGSRPEAGEPQADRRAESRSRGPRNPEEMLARLADPAQRAGMIGEKKRMLQASYQDLGEYLDLDDEQLDRFFDLVVRQELDVEEAQLRCYLADSCAPGYVDPSLQEAQRREISEQFGAQVPQAWADYRETSHIRRTVRELRNRLPDKYRLTQEQSAALTTALNEVIQHIRSSGGQKRVPVMQEDGLLFHPMSGEHEQESRQIAANYNRMLRDRAGTILSPEQLAVFEKMQREALEGLPKIVTVR